MSELNEFQKILLSTYSDPEAARCLNEQDVIGLSDVLLLFLFRELATTEGCTSRHEAIDRIEMVVSELNNFLQALP